MTEHAKGQFDVKVMPQADDTSVGDPSIGRFALDKTFHGDLDGNSKGQMLGSRTDQQTGGYVAIERFTGTLAGRKGSFSLQHVGRMQGGQSSMDIQVVPGSGTDAAAAPEGAIAMFASDVPASPAEPIPWSTPSTALSATPDAKPARAPMPDVVKGAGTVSPRDVDMARGLLKEMPAALREATRTVEGARAALCALFLGSGSPAIEVSRHIQLIATWTFLPFGTTIVLIGTLRANGSVVPPLVILFLSMFPIRLGIYYFGYPAIGSDILWWSFPLSSLASLAMAWAVYKRGGWRRTMPQPNLG